MIMNVKELIDILKIYPEDYKLFVRGYEDGFDDLKLIDEVDMKLNVHDEWYYGQHDLGDKYPNRNTTSVKGLILKGKI